MGENKGSTLTSNHTQEVAMGELMYHVFSTEMGWVAALASKRGLRSLTLQPSPQEAMEHLGPDASGAVDDPDSLSYVQTAIGGYFSGDIKALAILPLDLEDAAPFFKAAWEACRTIPPGETRSYGWLAQEAGRPRAARAAGQAMARNRIALAVPCHRVIGSDGSLHGYGMGGLAVKARLLEMEARHMAGGGEPA